MRLPALTPASGWVLPGPCEICRRWSSPSVCADCHERFAPAVLRCRSCGLTLGSDAVACGRCLRTPPPYALCCCAVDYRFPWDGLLAQFKFGNRPELATALCSLLVPALRPGLLDATVPRPAAVLPVPLSPRRLAERGYNQSWELARRLARALQLPANAQVLRRTRDTPAQMSLTRAQRQSNLAGAFSVDRVAAGAFAGQTVALVDDVMTTGATLAEAATVLRQAGAAAVQVWVVARTPDAQASANANANRALEAPCSTSSS